MMFTPSSSRVEKEHSRPMIIQEVRLIAPTAAGYIYAAAMSRLRYFAYAFADIFARVAAARAQSLPPRDIIAVRRATQEVYSSPRSG